MLSHVRAVLCTIVSIQARVLPIAEPPMERAQACFLHHVFRIDAIAGERACELIGIGQMRQHHGGEPQPVVVTVHAVSTIAVGNPPDTPVRKEHRSVHGARLSNRVRGRNGGRIEHAERTERGGILFPRRE